MWSRTWNGPFIWSRRLYEPITSLVWSGKARTFNRFMTWSIYGIRRQLIGVGSITEVRQRRARFIIGWVTAWGIRKVCHRDCQVLYTLVGLRKPRKSDGSSDWPRVRRKRTSMDVGAVSIRRDPRKSTMCEYLAHKANLLGMKIAWCASMAAQLYISQATELEFEW